MQLSQLAILGSDLEKTVTFPLLRNKVGPGVAL